MPLPYYAQQVYDFDRERFLTTTFLPKKNQEAALIMYAFHIEISKIASTTQEQMIRLIRLQWWRDCVSDIYSGKQRTEHELLAYLAPLMQSIPQDLFAQYFDSQDKFFSESLDTTEQIAEYGEHSMGCILKMILHAGTKNPHAHDEEIIKKIGQVNALLNSLRNNHQHSNKTGSNSPEEHSHNAPPNPTEQTNPYSKASALEAEEISRTSMGKKPDTSLHNFEKISEEIISKIRNNIHDLHKRKIQNKLLRRLSIYLAVAEYYANKPQKRLYSKKLTPQFIPPYLQIKMLFYFLRRCL